MAQDGSIEVAWKGQAFSYLMHHPGFNKTENYGSAGGHGHSSGGGYGAAPAAAHGGGYGGGGGHGGGGGYGAPAAPAARDGESVFQAGTGTWNGPAPRGAGRQVADAAIAAAAAAPIKEPGNVKLCCATGTAPGAPAAVYSIPILGMGTAAITSPEAVKTALGLGYRHFDGAEFYGNEKIVGEGLKGFSGDRSELFIVSKLWNTHHRPADVRVACENSLASLGVSYLDLYLIHWPEAWDPSYIWTPDSKATPVPDASGVTIQETWAAMEALVDAGLVRSIGVSNFSLPQVEALIAGGCKIKPAINQIELHPFLAQRKLVGVLFRKGIQCVAYSPLGGPGSVVANDLISDPEILKVAEEVGKTPAQVLLKWNMQRGIPVIPKASGEAHLRANLEGMLEWKLSNAHKARLDAMDKGKRFIDFPSWKVWGDVEEGGITKPSKVVL